MTVAAFVQFFGENTVSVPGSFTSTTPIYPSHVDFRGKFGDSRFGEDSGVLNNMCVYDPGNVTSNFGVNSPGESFSNAGRGIHRTAKGALAPNTIGGSHLSARLACEGVESRGTKLAYYSPSLGGFQSGISYSPSGSTRKPGGGYYHGADVTNQSAANVLSIGGNFNRDFGGAVSLTAGGAGEWAMNSYSALGAPQPDKPAVYTLGFQVAVPGGFAVGADGAYYQNYLHTSFSGATDAFGSDDAWVTSIGGSYAIGPVSVGLRGRFSRWSVYGTSLTGAYALGPGINLETQLAYSKYAANGQLAPGPVVIGSASFIQPQSYDAVELDAGFAVTF